MARMMADCRRWPSDTNCSLTILGEEDEVVRDTMEHVTELRVPLVVDIGFGSTWADAK